MPSINDMRRKLAAINTNTAAVEALDASEDIIKQVQIGQLRKGLNHLGEKLGDTEAPNGTINLYKWKSYADEKHKQNPFPGYGYPDLIRTGRFIGGFFLTVNSSTFVVGSTDDKNDKLVAKYDPFGLTPESRTIVINEKLRKEFILAIRKQLSK